MDEQTIYWIKAALANDDNSSDEEVRAYFIDGGLTEEEANEWVAKRTFYLNHIVMQDDHNNDTGIFDPKTRSIKPLAS